MDINGLLEHRKAKDEFFATSHHSPLSHAEQHSFDGLAYYEPNPDLVFTVPVEPADGAEVTIQTSDGQQRVYRRDATATVEVDGAPVMIALYTTGQPGYFIPCPMSHP